MRTSANKSSLLFFISQDLSRLIHGMSVIWARVMSQIASQEGERVEDGGTTGCTRTWTHREWATARKIRKRSLTPVGRWSRNRCDDGDSWMLPCVFHRHMLEPLVSTASFCFSQWFEACVSTQYYYFLAPFSSVIFSVLHSMAFLCFSSSSHFFPQLCSLSVPALIYPVGWPLCKILWEQDVPLIHN